jgi:hypothetical protein
MKNKRVGCGKVWVHLTHTQIRGRGGNDWSTMCKAKDWHRDDDRVPKRTHFETMKKDQKVHLYGRSMITKISLQPRKPHKRRNIRDSHRRERSNYKGHPTHQEGANRKVEFKTRTTKIKPKW